MEKAVAFSTARGIPKRGRPFTECESGMNPAPYELQIAQSVGRKELAEASRSVESSRIDANDPIGREASLIHPYPSIYIIDNLLTFSTDPRITIQRKIVNPRAASTRGISSCFLRYCIHFAERS